MRRVTEQADPYLRQRLGELPLLNREEILPLIAKAKEGDIKARNKIIEHNMRLVESISWKYANRGVSINDLVQEGVFGLINAIKSFDPSLETEFSTHATWGIKGAMSDAVAKQSAIVKQPVRELETLGKAIKDNGEGLPVENYAKQTGRSVEFTKELLGLRNHKMKISRIDPNAEDKKTDHAEGGIPNKRSSDLMKKIHDLILRGKLSERNLAITLRCLDAEERDGVTQDDIGKEFKDASGTKSISGERVRQIKNNTLKILQAACIEQTQST